MRYIVDNQVVLLRAPEGPLAVHIDSFAQLLREQGYANITIQKKVLLTAYFSRWLEKKGVKLRSIKSEHAIRYLQFLRKQARLRLGDTATLSQLIDFLRREGRIPTVKVSPSRFIPVERRMQSYERYLRDTRALAKATVVNYLPFIRKFLEGRFGRGRVNLARLKSSDVVRFVQREAPNLHLKRAKLMTAALRSFLQYTRYRGDVQLDLAAAVPVVANWSMPSIPRAIAADQVRNLLTSIDRRTAIGRRDYAILLLLARLGLRSGEVAFLELDDIDWKSGQLRVRGKRGLHNDLPLPKEVGKAIAAYLRRGRPNSTSRRVFLRAKAPFRGFQGASGVGSVVRHPIQRAGVDAPTHGAHQFRHGLATEMLRKGSSLTEIGEVLGHRDPQTTKIYTKVDIKALRKLALPWPGGA